jgi:DNA-binding transcriptional MerR regulator
MDESLSIREVAARTGLSTHTLRYYERVGLLTHVERGANGHRCYSDADLGWIDLLKRLRATGMSIADMKRYADFQREGDETFERRIALLEAHRVRVLRQLDVLQTNLGVIEYKIDYYTHEKEKLESCSEF